MELEELMIKMLNESCYNTLENGSMEFRFEGHCTGYTIIARPTKKVGQVPTDYTIESVESFDC